MSRRTLVKTVAGAGVAAGALGIVGVAQASPSHDAAAVSTGTAPSAAGAIVAHVTDLKTGTIEVFADDFHAQLRDVDLARRIARTAH